MHCTYNVRHGIELIYTIHSVLILRAYTKSTLLYSTAPCAYACACAMLHVLTQPFFFFFPSFLLIPLDASYYSRPGPSSFGMRMLMNSVQ